MPDTDLFRFTKEDKRLNEKNLTKMSKVEHPFRGTVIESRFVWYAKVDGGGGTEITLRQIVYAKQNLSGKIIELVSSK